MSATAKITPQAEAAAIVLFGLDGAGKAHASSFNQADASRAERAAEVMGMRVLRPNSDEQQALACKLPRGRVFATGKAFVPFVRADLYEALTALAGVSAAQTPASAKSASMASPAAPEGTLQAHLAPTTWDEISVGSLVLACEGPGDGWFEATVLKIEDDRFSLRWRDWPELRAFSRRSWQLALLPPGRRV